MRRILCVTLAAGILLVGCSSSKKSSTPSSSSSTTSGVAVSAENAAFCADMQTFVDDLNEYQKALTGSGAEQAKSIQTLYTAMMPSLDAALASAPAAAEPSLTTLKTAWAKAVLLDPGKTADQQELVKLVVLGPADVRAAMVSLESYAKTTCGITFVRQ